ncbi:EamA family transporter [Fimbriiglobus ruber]|uniref:Permease of the drug/metabolite transporter (DMT) superfamily n=1 Tax=Fimbriiglobus ruber TaxID=1908690 RepID=A0A225DSV2_9BACT|nr:EamA family transporter [Fimbriiglobus ruber]OWK44401.1 Permease of the drug/metabolite transporter (DMT) superfamily [Fimbriiglobus ruber]
MEISDSRPSRIGLLLAFAAVYVLWGSTYLAIRLAIDSIPPFLMAGSRFVVAGAILFAYGSQRYAGRLTLVQWRNAALASVPLFVIGNGGVTWAEQSVPSGLAALVVATIPVWMLLFDWMYGGRRGPRRAELMGVGAGLAGVTVLAAPGADGGSPAGIGALVFSAVGWSCGSLVNRYADLPKSPFMISGMEMLVGGVFLLGVGLVTGEASRFDPVAVSWQSGAALVYLIAVAVVALPAYTWLMTVCSPALVGTYAFVNPVIAVLLGCAVLGEELTSQTLAAIALVVVGVALLTRPQKSVSSPGERRREVLVIEEGV